MYTVYIYSCVCSCDASELLSWESSSSGVGRCQRYVGVQWTNGHASSHSLAGNMTPGKRVTGKRVHSRKHMVVHYSLLSCSSCTRHFSCLQTVWVKLFGNANENTKAMFKDKFKVRSTPCFIVFKRGQVGL